MWADGRSPIYLYAIRASILTPQISNARGAACPRPFVLFVGDLAVVASLSDGSSSSELGSLVAHLFWNASARGSARRRIEYVNTKASSADYPSRQCNAGDWGPVSRSAGTSPKPTRVRSHLWGSFFAGPSCLQWCRWNMISRFCVTMVSLALGNRF